MATHLQSNPLYYSSSLPTSTATRTVFLQKKGNQHSFGVYVGQDVPNGLYVVTVELGSPAADAQIQPGDRVVAVNDQYVSQMTGNPKRTLMDLAMHSQTLTLMIQSTNIFQQLNLPPPHHHASHGSTTMADITASLPHHPPLPARKPLRTRSPEVNVDLERYIKSLFGDENIQILPSSNFPPNSNEFVLTAGQTGRPPLINSHHPHSTRHSHSHRHRRHAKRVPVRTTETQTSAIDENQHSPPIRTIPPTQPSMGTSQVMLKTQKSAAEVPDARDQASTNPSLESIPNVRVTRPSPPSATSTPAVKKTPVEDNSPPQHMVDIVQAAMDATKRRDQDEKRARPPSPIEERPSAESGVYRVRQAEQNSSSNPYAPAAPAAPPAPAFPSTIRGENLRRIHLKRASNFNGYGFHLQYNKVYYLVHRVENGSPSETGNLRPNDVIHSINDKLTEKMPHPDFVQIVNSSAELDFVVQNLDDFLRAYPQAARPAPSTR